MKPWIRILTLVLLTGPLAGMVFAQQPLAGVTVTSPANESSGPYTSAVNFAASATGVPPYSITFLINGVNQGSATVWRPPQPGSYFITAKVTDAGGNTATSLPIRYFATGTVVNSPSNGTLIPEGSSVVLKADATTGGGFIQKVEFYADGTLLGSDDSAPYSFIYSPGLTASTSIATATAAINGSVSALTVTAAGSGYTSPPAVTFTGGGGAGAAATATLSGGVTNVTVGSGGSGYTSAPTVTFVGGGATTPATATAIVSGGAVTSVVIVSPGAGYTSAPTIVFGGPGINATASATITGTVASLTITAAGTGYSTPPTVTLTGGGGSGAAASSSIVGPVGSVTVTSGGSGYTTPPQVLLVGGGGTGATAASVVSGGAVTAIPLISGGSGYVSSPSVVIPSVVITARAYDNNGNALPDSPPIGLTMVKPIAPAPNVTISSPSSTDPTKPTGIGLSTSGSTIVPVSVDAVRGDTGRITKVELYVDGELINTKTAFPYTFDWTPRAAGTYVLVAIGYDDKNNAKASPAVYVRMGLPPTVTVKRPTSGQSLPAGTLTPLQAEVTTGGGSPIASVDFVVDDVFIGSATAPLAGAPTTYQVSATLTQKKDPATGLVIPSTIKVTATNNSGFTATSTPVSFTVTAGGGSGTPGTAPVGTPPSVAVTSPTASTQLTVNSPTTLYASATDSDGNISSVQFLVNNTAVGSSSVYPYQVSWTPTSLGTYAITAKATDNDGNTITSAAVTVTVVDPTPNPPTVAITFPATGATLPVNTPQTLRAAATDIGSITSVQFFVNGQPEGGAVTTFPYTTPWTPKSPGSYIISARATNASGIQATSSPIAVTVTSGTPPTISLANPGATITFGATANLTATATPGTGATIVGVQFLANGLSIGAPDTTFPYNAAWTPPAPGTYTLTAVATDSFGNQTTSAAATVTVTPSSTTAPFVFLTSPPTNTNVAANTPVVLAADAGDPDGTVASVGFLVNNQLISTAAGKPYSGLWIPTTPGTYTVTAVATDDAGNRTTSTSSTVTVLAQSGVVPVGSLDFNNPKIDTPTAGATPVAADPFKAVDVNYGSKLIFSAGAVDQDGTIASVQFFVNGASIATVTSPPYLTVYSLNTLSDVAVTAIVTDSSGNAVYANPIFIATKPAIGVADAAVNMVSPVNGGTYVTGRQITFSATHNFGNVDPPKIDFYIDGSQFTTVTKAGGGAASDPYTAVLGISRPGTYTVHAVARRGNSTTVSAPARITVVPNNPPSVSITSPAGGSSLVVGNAQTIVASALDSDGTVQSVQFFVNGSLLSSDSSSPFTATWSPAVGGTYVLTAAVTDDTGAQTLSAPVTVTVTNNQAPTVAITGPASGLTVGSGTIVNLTANAADADGKVASVRFLANGVVVGSATASPFVVPWTPTAAGSYTVIAQATDDSGNVTSSSSITINVSANRAPTVSLTAPANGTTVRVASGTTLTATASDADGTIASVQFFANGTAVGAAVTTPPYRAQWTPNSEGIYQITAVATDNAGTSTTSSPVSVLAVTSGGGDVIYTGNYLGGGESGRFAVVNVRGKTGSLIAYSTSPTGRTYFYPSLAIDASGGFSLADASGKVLVSGTVNDTGVVGTLDGGRVTMIGPAAFATGSAAVASGYYNGNLVNRAASTFAAIVGADGSIAIFATDGSFRDAGSGTVTSTGAFTVTTPLGNRFTGTVDPATGFLTGALSGTLSANFMAANASGSSFSDGFLRNLSTRGQVGTGANLLIAGFVVAGNSPKQVLIRAVGPTLTTFGITGALVDTQLELFNGNTRIASNDNWGGDAAIASASSRAGAFPLSPSSFDSVLLMTLSPGSYTAQVSGVAGRTGIALIELYDIDSLQPFSSQKVTNVATRGVVGTGQGQLIAGFVVSGNTAKKVLIRAVGPTLGGAPFNVSGALADPFLRLVRGDSQIVRENDNWEQGNDAALLSDAAVRVGAFPLAAGSRDAAILINLPPGTYSAQVSGAGTSTGVALVEVYEVP